MSEGIAVANEPVQRTGFTCETSVEQAEGIAAANEPVQRTEMRKTTS